MNSMTRITLTTEDLAQIIGTSKDAVRKMLRTGRIRTDLTATRVFADIEAARTRVANRRYHTLYSDGDPYKK